MKIAVITSYVLESSFALVKHLADQNIEVHLFALMPMQNQNLFVVDFSKNLQKCGFVPDDVLKTQMGEGLCNYLSKVNTRVFGFPGGGPRLIVHNTFYARKLCQHIIKMNFDVINIIHTSGNFSLLLYHFLRNEKLVQTLHEVTDHTNKGTPSSNVKILKHLIKKSIPVIFHSNISKLRFISFRQSVTNTSFDKNLYTMIRFSLYETYKCFSTNNTSVILPEKNIPIIFHFGRIVPYKGIDVLIDAIKIVQQKQDVHLIIAGAGTPYFDFNGIKRFTFLNRPVSNEEIVLFIKSCAMVVCPYKSVSQSGIPMVVYAFNKPIVASNMGGFAEIIENNITGILVDEIDAPSFAIAIENLLTNDELVKNIEHNINNKFSTGDLSWLNIAKKSLDFYEYHMDKEKNFLN